MTNKWKNLRNEEEDQYFLELDLASENLRAGARRFSEALKKVPPKERRMEKLIEALDYVSSVEIRVFDEALAMAEEAILKFVLKKPSKHPFGPHIVGKQSAELKMLMTHLIENCGDFFTKGLEITKKYDSTFVPDITGYFFDKHK